MVTPEIRPNPRDDLFVTDASFRDCQRTTYSGRLHFGPPANYGVMLSKFEWNGALFLPDSHAYRADRVADAVVAGDFWVQAMNDHLYLPASGAQLAGDANNPGFVWVQIGMNVLGYSGSIIGYRVSVTVGRDAVAT